MMRSILFVGLCLSIWLVIGVGGWTAASAQGRMRQRMPTFEYGTIVMNRFAEANNVAPVIFRHWVHRAKHTCRLCHIDIGFAMEAGATEVTEADNRAGRYCGVCHNGKEVFGWEDKGALGGGQKNCARCHSEYPVGQNPEVESKFAKLAEDLPKGRFGNGIDWLAAEEQGLLKPKDFIAGVSFDRPKMKHEQGEIKIDAKLTGLPDILFSHQKHAVWNGCELCHPEIFTLKAGGTKFTMKENFEGKFCGSCHGKVAFPNKDCGLCHAKGVEGGK